MKRNDGRAFDQLRELHIQRNFIKHTHGSCLIELGDTRVVCTALADQNVPAFLKGSGTGWVTSEYGMLPGSAQTRIVRDKISGRRMEIQRLVGRALRSVVDTKTLGERTIWVDCDVIQADGGTRIASVIGGFIALVDCLQKLYKERTISQLCVKDFLGAVSVGIWNGQCVLDLNFQEDSSAGVDMNVVMKGNGEFIELQGTAEHGSFSQKDLTSFLQLAQKGIEEIIAIEKKLFKDVMIG